MRDSAFTGGTSKCEIIRCHENAGVESVLAPLSRFPPVAPRFGDNIGCAAFEQMMFR